jgi:hypothetical protein
MAAEGATKDRRPPVHQPEHRRLPPPQGVPEARGVIPPAAPTSADLPVDGPSSSAIPPLPPASLRRTALRGKWCDPVRWSWQSSNG